MQIKERQQGLLPVEAYISQAWYEWEQDTLWGSNWHFAGMITDLAEPGDYMTVQVGRNPIFVVRGQDHRLRAFHNICRHRGTQLLRAKGKSDKNIVCPYHNWRYSLNGQLLQIPEQESQYAGQEIDKGQLCLHKAAVETWREMIFVHPKPKPDPFMQWLDDVPNHTGPHQVDKLVEYDGTRYTHEAQANWKIIIENAVDGYHLAHLHSDTLNMYDHKQQQWSYAGMHWVFVEPLADWYRQDVHNLAPYGVIDHLPEEKLAAYLYHLFPSVLITETEGTWSTFQVTPLAPDRTLIDIRTRVQPMTTTSYYAQGAKSWWAWGKQANDTATEDHDQDDPLQSENFMAEDIYACEQQQKAMYSPLYSTGPASRDEQSILGFHKAVTKFCSPEEWQWRSKG